MWFLNVGKNELRVPVGKIIAAAPCDVVYQKEMLIELQGFNPRLKISDENQIPLKEETPILMAKYLMNLHGAELKSFFFWWCQEFKLDLNQSDALTQMIPQKETQWNDLKIEKRIALFLGVALKSREFSFAFFDDIHLEQNAQTFLFNFIKNMTQTSSHQVIIFWSYHLVLPGSIPLFFKGFKHNAA